MDDKTDNCWISNQDIYSIRVFLYWRSSMSTLSTPLRLVTPALNVAYVSLDTPLEKTDAERYENEVYGD